MTDFEKRGSALAESTGRAGQSGERRLPRGLGIGLCFTALIWAAAARLVAGKAAAGIATRFHLELQQSLLEGAFLLFLVVVGFQTLDWLATRGTPASVPGTSVLALPQRKTSGTEWLTGAAIGWGMCLAAVLPALLSGHYHAQLNHGRGVPGGVLTTAATLVLVTLAEEAIFRGYPFRALGQSIGPAWASVLLSAAFALVLVAGDTPANLGGALLNIFLFGILLSIAYLRTHALWIGWGLHFGFRAVMAILLGLPIAGRGDSASLTDGYVRGPRWLTGGAFGLDAALFTLVVMLIAMAVLYRATKDWAWAYTLPEIVGAGYEVTVAPPAAHVAMEKAAAPPPLVQIMPVAPPPPIPMLPRDPERES